MKQAKIQNDQSEIVGANQTASAREQLNLVIAGHVDHGKSTVIGRLLADLGALPEGKLERVQEFCALHSRPFEYAFLLDALKSEQSQGITIDTARCFFSTPQRDYILNDAPGHVEFLKNMITGAARAEAAFLIIDVREGIQENSRRHGYLLSMLGIRQLSVLLNKMDLVEYRQETFEQVRREYSAFLERLGLHPLSTIPICASRGENLVSRSPEMPWYQGFTVAEQLEHFEKQRPAEGAVFRLPVQDVYKFTDAGDDRRIVAGTIQTGQIQVGEEVRFFPSGKSSCIQSIETFNAPSIQQAIAGQSPGFVLTDPIYVRPGELMCRAADPPPQVGRQFRANLFWWGRAPMVPGRRYKLKVGAARGAVQLSEVLHVVETGDLSALGRKGQIDRHDVAECILETLRPMAFDPAARLEATGRFVIVDQHEIAGCGCILESLGMEPGLLKQQVIRREALWEAGYVQTATRQARNQHPGKFIVITGSPAVPVRELAKQLELRLFKERHQAYFLSPSCLEATGSSEGQTGLKEEQIEQLGEVARVLTGAGLLFITCLEDIDQYDLERLRRLNEPHELFVITWDLQLPGGDAPQADLQANQSITEAMEKVLGDLNTARIVADFQI
jgi:bifunctional enzyme CysN/CysC